MLNTMEVEDDRPLLNQMLTDLKQAPDIYQPTQYWQTYFERTVQYLQNKGLKNFRSSRDVFLSSFGASDLDPISIPIGKIVETDATREVKTGLTGYLNLICQHPNWPLLPFSISVMDLYENQYRMADMFGRLRGAVPLETLSASLNGSPHHFSYDTRPYTELFLFFYWRYAYCCQFIDFNQIDNIVEIGSGSGKQVEVIKKAHPHINFYLLDLAPQLYVCNQFLKSVFPKHVIGYRTSLGSSEIRAEYPGSNYTLGTWQIENLRPRGTTLFWNSASFGEMEPDVVENYLQKIQPFSDAVYLFQCMTGKEIAGVHGPNGVKEQTTLEHYRRFLAPTHGLIDNSKSYTPLSRVKESGGYEDAMWIKHNLHSGFIRDIPQNPN